MKKIKLIIITILTVVISDFAYSVDPTYTLTLSTPTNINSNTIEFDIYLKHTNPAVSNFYYSMGQYVLYIPSVSSQGGNLTYTFSPGSNVSDLPLELRPVNPTVFVNSNSIQLRLAANVPASSYPGQPNPVFTISSNGNGTKIARMRLQTTALRFELLHHINWKNTGDYFTKIICNNFSATQSLVKNITNSTNHISPSSNINVISGKVFLDYNENGVQDSGEPNYASAFSTSVGVSSLKNGIYCAHTSPGNFTISLVGLPSNYISNPVIQTAEFAGYGYVDDFNDFALTTTQNINDVKVSMTGYTQRPGFTVQKYLTYQNVGTGPKTGTIEMVHDSSLTFISSDLPSTYDPVTHMITWNYSSLSPGPGGIIRMLFSLPANTPLGKQLSSTATIYPITGDAKPLNNVYTYNETVKGSFDPNDISVEPSGKITPQEVSNEDPLTYTIRFQNTGTDTAFTVKVSDTISPNLNKESIEVISSSHDWAYEINENGILEFTFSYIQLPDSTTNEPESHGFIQYSIKPKNTLVTGDSIKNTAYIYFDYNDPVVTNTVNTVIGLRSNYLDLSWKLEAMFPVADTLSVKLRNSVPPYDLVDSAKVLGELSSTFYKNKIGFENISPGNFYYIVVNHRSSIETWSAQPVEILTDTTFYDFTSSLSQAYGNNMIDVNGKASFYSGDVNQDGLIELSDIVEVSNDAANFTNGNVITDLNGDGLVDLSDLTTVFNNSSNFITVLKP